MLWEYTKRNDTYGATKYLNEPLVGNPIRIIYDNKYISQDLCNSINEFNIIMNHVILPANPKILEIGAGYGRTAFVFCSSLECEYTILDIEPALTISKKYLSEVLPNKKITFITPQDINEIEDDYFDLVINISSFQEMTYEIIQVYFDFINRTCSGYMYMKEWIKWFNPIDNISISYKYYPINKHWSKILCKKNIIYNKFFESIYKIKGNK